MNQNQNIDASVPPLAAMPAELPLPSINPMALIRDAVGRGAGIDVLEKLMTLQERYEKNEARKAFDAALADAKAELPIIEKNRQVGFDSKKVGAGRTSFRHADLAEIVRVVSPILAKHGLSHRWRCSSEPNEPVVVTCVVSHRDGYFIENTLRAGRDDSGSKNPIQAMGSTITYLSRYTLMAALGLAAAEDDDGGPQLDATPITEVQVTQLKAELKRVGLKEERFLKKFEIKQLADLPVGLLEEAFAAIVTYAVEKANREADGTPDQTQGRAG